MPITPLEVFKNLSLAMAESDYLNNLFSELARPPKYNEKINGFKNVKEIYDAYTLQLEKLLNEYRAMANSTFIINENAKLERIYELCIEIRESMSAIHNAFMKNVKKSFIVPKEKMFSIVQNGISEALEYKLNIHKLGQRVEEYPDFKNDFNRVESLEKNFRNDLKIIQKSDTLGHKFNVIQGRIAGKVNKLGKNREDEKEIAEVIESYKQQLGVLLKTIIDSFKFFYPSYNMTQVNYKELQRLVEDSNPFKKRPIKDGALMRAAVQKELSRPNTNKGPSLTKEELESIRADRQRLFKSSKELEAKKIEKLLESHAISAEPKHKKRKR